MIKQLVLNERSVKLAKQGRLGFVAPTRGQEASQTATSFAFNDADYLMPGYRDIPQMIHKGFPIYKAFLWSRGHHEGNLMEGINTWFPQIIIGAQFVEAAGIGLGMETSDEWISSRTGIRRRHIVRDENTSDLASNVAQQLLKKASLAAEDLDFIIVATVSPDGNMPSTASLVQAKIGASKAFAFDLTAACSGFVYALSVADKLIASGAYHNGIVIGAEVLSKIVDWSDRSTSVLFGDGAGGVLLQASSDTPLILAESLKSDGNRGMSSQVIMTQPFWVKHFYLIT